MELEAHLNKESVLYFAAKNVARRPYVHKRGKQSRTLIREMQQRHSSESDECSYAYSKILIGYWQRKSSQNPLYDNQDHESGNCTCKCTPTPKQNPTCPSDDKRRRKRDDKHHLRGRPYAHIQAERKSEKEAV